MPVKRIKDHKTSLYRNVSFLQGKWTVRIEHEGELHHVGTFEDEEEAAWAGDLAKLWIVGEGAHFNFPERIEEILQEANLELYLDDSNNIHARLNPPEGGEEAAEDCWKRGFWECNRFYKSELERVLDED